MSANICITPCLTFCTVRASNSFRMTNACQTKCIPTHYKEGDLTKAEAVCLDRCVAKYLHVHDKLGKKLTQLSSQDEAALQKAATQQ